MLYLSVSEVWLMNERVYLHVPDVDEMWYRRRLLMDEATMGFNAGREASEGYDAATGCVNFPQSKWQAWYDGHIDNEPEKFFAFIARKADLEFVGWVSLSREGEDYEIEVVVEDQYRRQGYGSEAMELVLQVAFEVCNAPKVASEFASAREAAVKLCEKAGFKAENKGDMVRMTMTHDEFGYAPKPSDF